MGNAFRFYSLFPLLMTGILPVYSQSVSARAALLNHLAIYVVDVKAVLPSIGI